MCVVVTLAVLLLLHGSDSLTSVNAYVPMIVATMLAIGLAGAEWQVFLERNSAERLVDAAKFEAAEHQAADRQHAFNQLWQLLADSRGQDAVPAEAMEHLRELFPAELCVVWAARDGQRSYRVCGLQPAQAETWARLDKIAQSAPCFERVREVKRVLPVTDLVHDTAPALALFCEQRELRQAILCPVLVRQELVGVLAFFHKQPVKLTTKTAEEMQSAANLFLCAL